MDTLKTMAWAVVKNEVGKEARRTWKDIRKEIKEGKGKRRDERKIKNVVELEEQVGWLPLLKDQWKIEQKREIWRDIHRDIVSTRICNTMKHVYGRYQHCFIVYFRSTKENTGRRQGWNGCLTWATMGLVGASFFERLTGNGDPYGTRKMLCKCYVNKS